MRVSGNLTSKYWCPFRVQRFSDNSGLNRRENRGRLREPEFVSLQGGRRNFLISEGSISPGTRKRGETTFPSASSVEYQWTPRIGVAVEDAVSEEQKLQKRRNFKLRKRQGQGITLNSYKRKVDAGLKAVLQKLCDGTIGKDRFLAMLRNRLPDFFDELLQVCDEMADSLEAGSGPLVYENLIWIYSELGFCEKAKRVLMIAVQFHAKPPTDVFLYLIRACGKAWQPEKGQEVYIEMIKNGILPTREVLLALADMFSTCLMEAEAVSVRRHVDQYTNRRWAGSSSTANGVDGEEPIVSSARFERVLVLDDTVSATAAIRHDESPAVMTPFEDTLSLYLNSFGGFDGARSSTLLKMLEGQELSVSIYEKALHFLSEKVVQCPQAVLSSQVLEEACSYLGLLVNQVDGPDNQLNDRSRAPRAELLSRADDGTIEIQNLDPFPSLLMEISYIWIHMRTRQVAPSLGCWLPLISAFFFQGFLDLSGKLLEESTMWHPQFWVSGAKTWPRKQVLLLGRHGKIESAEFLARKLSSLGYKADSHFCNTFLQLYIIERNYRKVIRLFRGMTPNRSTFCILADMYLRRNMPEESFHILRETMRHGFQPTNLILYQIMSCFKAKKEWKKAKDVFNFISESGGNPSSEIQNLMFSILSEFGQLQEIQEMKKIGFLSDSTAFPSRSVIKKSPDSPVLDVFEYTQIIDNFVKNDQMGAALLTLEEMADQNVSPNYVTFTSLLSGASLLESEKAVSQILSKLEVFGFDLPNRFFFGQCSAVNWEITENCAFDVFMEASEHAPGLCNVMIDLLRNFGHKKKAARLFACGLQANLYPTFKSSVEQNDWSADFRGLSSGAAYVALHDWLQKMQRKLMGTVRDSGPYVTIVTGYGVFDNQVSVLRSLKYHFYSVNAPFHEVEGKPGLLRAKAYSLERWLKDSPHCRRLELVDAEEALEGNAMKVYEGALVSRALVETLERLRSYGIEDLPRKVFARFMNKPADKQQEFIDAEVRTRVGRAERKERRRRERQFGLGKFSRRRGG